MPKVSLTANELETINSINSTLSEEGIGESLVSIDLVFENGLRGSIAKDMDGEWFYIPRVSTAL